MAVIRVEKNKNYTVMSFDFSRAVKQVSARRLRTCARENKRRRAFAQWENQTRNGRVLRVNFVFEKNTCAATAVSHKKLQTD